MCAVVAVTTRSGAVGANRIFGLKTKNTLRSEHAWQSGHHAAQPWMWAAFFIGVSGGAGALLGLSLGHIDAAQLAAWIACGLTVLALVLGTLRADRSAASAR
ncbi:SdpI family protein [Micrococcus endophyticus]|uniref:SdpI family protein n=1 Tax=Micrococcus endophyticus TaxID=455343 RepID=UPI003B83333A